jgi:hypothetical protein
LERWYYEKKTGKEPLKNEGNDLTPGGDRETEGNKEISKGCTVFGEPRKRAPGGGRKPQVKSNPNEKLLDKMFSLLEELGTRELTGIDVSRMTNMVVTMQQ